jgi:hypothetical protein
LKKFQTPVTKSIDFTSIFSASLYRRESKTHLPILLVNLERKDHIRKITQNISILLKEHYNIKASKFNYILEILFLVHGWKSNASQMEKMLLILKLRAKPL